MSPSRCRRRWLLALLIGGLSLGGPGSALASDPIDVLTLYTPLAKQELGGTHEAVAAAVAAEFGESNQAFGNSDLDASFRYQVVAIQELCFDEREKIRMDLQWLHESLQVAALREAAGADVVLLLTGTANYGGMAWAIYSNSSSQRKHAFIVVEAFALGTLTSGHELGHTMGCSHNPEVLILPDPPVNSNYGYMHWQEEPYFRTLLSYYSRPNPDGPGVIVCDGCKENQLNVFSSPGVWYMYAGPGDTLEELCILEDNGDGNHSVSCADGSSASVPSNDLESYGIPVGTSLSNNRVQVQSRYDITAGYFDPPLASGCAENCAALSRTSCTQAGGACGGCAWPTVESAAGSCLGRASPVIPTPRSDGCYGDAGSVPPVDGSFSEEILDLGVLHVLERVDLHFGTWDAATGLPSFEWAPNSFSNWNPPPPPQYNWELEGSVDGSNWTLLESGTRDTPAANLVGASSGHHMMWRAWETTVPGTEVAARYLKVRVQSCLDSPCEYTVGLHEIDAFGTSVAATPALGPAAIALLTLALGVAGAWSRPRLSRPTRSAVSGWIIKLNGPPPHPQPRENGYRHHWSKKSEHRATERYLRGIRPYTSSNTRRIFGSKGGSRLTSSP